MRVLLTGASGYLAKSLINLAQRESIELILASRIPLKTGSQSVRFDISDLSTHIIPENVDAIIHLAARTDNIKPEDDDEVVAAETLIHIARKSNIKFIFISSQTANEFAPTHYGRIKWEIEQNVLKNDGFVVRLGQVYGRQEYGLFGLLVNTVRTLPVLPSFMPAPKVQPIHVDDCAAGIISVLKSKKLISSVYSLASPEAISFTDFLKSIAKYRLYIYRFSIPVPVLLVKLVSGVIGRKLSDVTGLSRLESLFGLPLMKTENDLNAIGLKLRALNSGLHKSGNGNRRALMLEGLTLFGYILKSKPESSLVRRYVRMIEAMRPSRALTIPAVFIRYPQLIAILESKKSLNPRFKEELTWRIDAVTLLLEATPQGSFRFLRMTGKHNIFVSVIGIGFSVLTEIMWRILSFILPVCLIGLCDFENENAS